MCAGNTEIIREAILKAVVDYKNGFGRRKKLAEKLVRLKLFIHKNGIQEKSSRLYFAEYSFRIETALSPDMYPSCWFVLGLTTVKPLTGK